MFGAADAPGSTASVVVNETLAQEFWPKEDALGQQLRFGEERTVCTIVGVVRDIKTHNLRARPRMQIYVPLAQFPSATLGFVVRTAGESTEIGTAVRDAIWAVDRDQPISSVEPLERLMVIVDTGDRVMTKLMVFFGLLAMFLGTIGIYGVMSDQVSQRTHEIGIRTTLGANSLQVMGMVVGQALRLSIHWNCHWHRGSVCGDAIARGHALSSEPRRSGDFRGSGSAVCHGGDGCVLHPGAAGEESGTDGGAEIRVKRSDQWSVISKQRQRRVMRKVATERPHVSPRRTRAGRELQNRG